MKQILLVHPQFRSIGGAEVVAIHMLQWLLERADARTTLLTFAPPDFKEIYRATGIFVAPDNLTVEAVSLPFRLERTRQSFELLKTVLLHRHARKLTGRFDVCVSAYNELDFGRSTKGFQYIHHPLFPDREKLREVGLLGTRTLRDAIPFFNDLYGGIVKLFVSGNNDFTKNITMVNSIFMQGIVKSLYGIESVVLYPGFLPDATSNVLPSWEDREFLFTSVGRISADKEILELLSLFRLLADAFPDARFVIAGRVAESAYFREVQQTAKHLRLPIRFMLDCPRDELDRLLKTTKIFIHPKANEHFGIAVLEAAHAGCLTFVPDSGGQREIVTPAILRFSNGGDLVEKVKKVLQEKDLRVRTLLGLKDGLQQFRLGAFRAGLDEIMGGTV